MIKPWRCLLTDSMHTSKMPRAHPVASGGGRLHGWGGYFPFPQAQTFFLSLETSQIKVCRQPQTTILWFAPISTDDCISSPSLGSATVSLPPPPPHNSVVLGLLFFSSPSVAVCGGILHGPEGSFSSPNYPEPYPPDVLCKWQIQVMPGMVIQLKVEVLEVENSASCLYDRLEIYKEQDGASLWDGSTW